MYNNLVLVLPRINYIDYKLNNERLLIRELGSLKYASDNYVISDYTLNVTNSYSVNYLKENNVKRITLSTEFDKNNIDIKDKNDLEMIIYGKIELAISKYCVISNVLNKNKGCKLCRDNNFYLSDRLNSKYKLINDEYCNSIILSSRPYDNIDLIEKYIDSGISNFRLNFYDESEDTIINILNKIYK